MKKIHKIETIDDIKYCEENGLRIYPKTKGYYFEFQNGIWNEYKENDSLVSYQTTLFVSDDLYYYEEQEQQEASEKDIGKLCWFWDGDDEDKKFIGKLVDINDADGLFEVDGDANMNHCRPLTKEEIKEFMEKAE